MLNQVTVRLGTDLDGVAAADLMTRAAIASIQADGVCFLGGAQWRGRWIVRISISGYATTQADVDRSAAAIIKAWRTVRANA